MFPVSEISGDERLVVGCNRLWLNSTICFSNGFGGCLGLSGSPGRLVGGRSELIRDIWVIGVVSDINPTGVGGHKGQRKWSFDGGGRLVDGYPSDSRSVGSSDTWLTFFDYHRSRVSLPEE